MDRRDLMVQFASELDPADEHAAELAASFVRRGAVRASPWVLGVLGPTADEGAVVITYLFDGGPDHRSVEPRF